MDHFGGAGMFWICTHHRCGTVLMRNMFREFADRSGTVFHKGPLDACPDDTRFFQDAHSRLRMPESAHGIHLYRDPYDMLLSHIRYHRTTNSPTEPPNIIRMDDGRTYKEHLLTLENLEDAAIFELGNVFGRSLKSMLDWNYDDERFLNVGLDEIGTLRSGFRIIEELVRRFEEFAGHEDVLFEAFAYVVGIQNMRDRHGTREPGEVAYDVIPVSVRTRMMQEYPSLERFERRFFPERSSVLG